MSIFRSQGKPIWHYSYDGLIASILIQPYEWRGLRQTRGLRSKAKRVLSQFSPHDFTAFKWGTASSFLHYIIVVLLLAVFLAAELNPFYLKVVFRSRSVFVVAKILRGGRRFYGWNPIIP